MTDITRSIKHIQIDKANARMVAVVSVSIAMTVFSIVASRALVSDLLYKNRVIKEKNVALKQLKTNVAAIDTLVESYKQFDSTSESVIGTKEHNSKIILDALPSKYDFPALASSLEKLLVDGGYSVQGISGSDQELSAQQSSNLPIPIDMPFQLSASGSFDSLQNLFKDMQRSIRPFVISSYSISGSDGNLTMNIDAKTFYQPEKTLELTTKVVK